MNCTEEGYVNMLCSFRTNDLQALLAAFNRNKNGRKSELKERALELLRNRPTPTGFNYQAYLAKIHEIFRTIQQNDMSPNNDMMRNMMQNQRQVINIAQHQAQQIQQRMYQPPMYQQTMNMLRSGLPQVMPQIQRGGMYGSNITGGTSSASNNNIQYSYQIPNSRNMVSNAPTNQINMGTQNSLRYDMNTQASGNATSINSSIPSLTNIMLKKLPFYEVIAEVVKPITLIGQERCTLPMNMAKAPTGMREATIKLIMMLRHVNLISSNRDISNGKNEYPFQIQIRICLLEPGSTEISDFLPLGLNIRVNNKCCPLPPTAPNNRPGVENRRIARPINCTTLLKLNPLVANPITVNWIPDGKTYVMGIYLVNKLSSDILLQKLKDKGARSSEETKNYIIKKLRDFDPDLATTSYRCSLVCPLGKMRMKVPAKSINCNHFQCFDASIFILMNEKKPTWMCPTCNNPCLYDDIQIESYFLEVVTSPNLSDSCKEIEILADGTWKACEEEKGNKNSESVTTNVTKDKPIYSVNLDDSDDGNDEVIDPKKELTLEGSLKDNENLKSSSLKDNENLKSSFVDLTLSDDEEQPPTDKDKQENEAQAVDAVQPVTTIDLKPQAQVQPQQAVTSSEQGVVIELDSPSPPTSPTPTTTAS